MGSMIRYWPTALLVLGIASVVVLVIRDQHRPMPSDFEDGYLALQHKEYDSAIGSFNQVLARDPENSETLYHRGKAYFGKKDHELALADFNKAILLDKQEQEYYYGRIILNLHHDRNLDQALADASSLRAIVSKNPSIFRILAMVHLQRKEFQEALLDINQAIQLGVETGHPDAKTFLFRAEIYSALKEFDRAIDDCSEALKIDKQSAEAYRLRGSCLHAGRMNRLALPDLNRALEMMPLNADIHATRAMIHFNSNAIPEAISDWNQAIHLEPDDPEHRLGRGFAYLRQRNYPCAVADFEEVIRQAPELPHGYHGLAYLWATAPDAGQRNGEKAVIFARKALERSRQPNGKLLSTLASAYAEVNDFDRAIDTQKEALQLNSDFLPQEYVQAKERLSLYEHTQPFRDKPLP